MIEEGCRTDVEEEEREKGRRIEGEEGERGERVREEGCRTEGAVKHTRAMSGAALQIVLYLGKAIIMSHYFHSRDSTYLFLWANGFFQLKSDYV